MVLDPAVQRALAIDESSSAWQRTVDITTTGARTGRLRRIEIWFHRVGGRYYLSTLPGRPSWYFNLVANPRFTFHSSTEWRRTSPPPPYRSPTTRPAGAYSSTSSTT
jgi:F420H(2)-dependent quinone reductase